MTCANFVQARADTTPTRTTIRTGDNAEAEQMHNSARRAWTGWTGMGLLERRRSMINQLKSGITRLRGCLQAFVVGITMLAVITPAPVFAHGGFDHVLGTVVKVS